MGGGMTQVNLKAGSDTYKAADVVQAAIQLRNTFSSKERDGNI